MLAARAFLGATLAWLAGSGLASAQVGAERLGDPYLGVALRGAPVSDLDLSADRTFFDGEIVHPEFTFDGDTEVDLGGELSYTHPLLPSFSLAGRLTGHTFEWLFGFATRRDVVASLSIAPQARLSLSESFELYASLAVGVAVLWTGALDPAMSQAPDGSRASEFGLGWHLAPVAGVRTAADRHVGVFFEVGASLQQFSHEVGVLINDAGTTVPNTTQTSIVQLVVTLGPYFNLPGS